MADYARIDSVQPYRRRKRKYPGKPGRPPLGQMARSKAVMAMFTPDEYAQLQAAARDRGMTVSSYVWARAIGR